MRVVSENIKLHSGLLMYPVGEGLPVHSHFGELIQGLSLIEGRVRPHLITLRCPRFHSKARLGYTKKALPRNARKLVEFLDEKYDFNTPNVIEIESNIPVGAGAGSSTADLYAILDGYAKIYNLRFSTEERRQFVHGIEKSSDPIFGEGVFLYNQLDGEIVKEYTHEPLEVICVGTFSRIGAVITDRYTKRPCCVSDSEYHKTVISIIERGFRTGDLRLISRASYLSALKNQSTISLPDFSFFEGIAERFSIGGFSISHSGSCVGFLLNKRQEETIKHIEQELERNDYSVVTFKTTL